MSLKTDHINYIKEKGEFKIDCSNAIFTIEEIDCLRKFGHWFAALENGILKPISDMQIEFIKVAKYEKEPISPEERAWFKYKGRKKLEAKMGDKLYVTYTLEQDSFYNRDMAKQLRSTLFKTMNENHRK